MKFFKGILAGSMFCAGAVILYKEGMFNKLTKMKQMKKGRKLIKKLGII